MAIREHDCALYYVYNWGNGLDFECEIRPLSSVECYLGIGAKRVGQGNNEQTTTFVPHREDYVKHFYINLYNQPTFVFAIAYAHSRRVLHRVDPVPCLGSIHFDTLGVVIR